MEEIWKEIYYFNKPTNEWIDYRGIYEISTLGRIRSVDRHVRGYNHGVEFERIIKGQILKTRPNRNGYYLAHLAKNGKHRDYSVHRLVYFTFYPDADTNLTINHMDENISNNVLTNLELLSQAENNGYGSRGARISEKLIEARKKKFWNNKSKTFSTTP